MGDQTFSSKSQASLLKLTGSEWGKFARLGSFAAAFAQALSGYEECRLQCLRLSLKALCKIRRFGSMAESWQDGRAMRLAQMAAALLVGLALFVSAAISSPGRASAEGAEISNGLV